MRRPLTASILSVTSLFLGGISVNAQDTFTWNGGGGANTNWSAAANWGGTAPNGNDILTFTGFTNLTSNNDLALIQYRLIFASGAGGFTLNGNAITLQDFGGLAPRIENNSSSAQTINLALTLDGAGTGGIGEIAAIGGNMTFGAAITLLENTELDLYGAGRTLIFRGAIGQSGGTSKVVLKDAATVEFRAANTYTGNTEINAGIMQLAVTGGISASSQVFVGDATGVATAASLLLTGANILIDSTITVNPGNGTNRTIGGTNSAGTNTFNGLIKLDGGVGENRTVSVTAASGGTVAFTNTISGADQGVLKTGSGTVVLSGNNTFSGPVVVNSGTLSVGASNNLGNGGANNTVTLSGGTLRTTGSFSFTRTLTLTGNPSTSSPNGSLDVAAGSTLTLNNAPTSTNQIVGKAGLGTVVSSVNSGAPFGPGSFTITGGTVTLSPSGSGADVSLTGGTSGSVSGITMVTSGFGYSFPSFTFSPPPSGTTAGSVTTFVISGSIILASAGNGGSGYTSAPSITITGGTGATAIVSALNVFSFDPSSALRLDRGTNNSLTYTFGVPGSPVNSVLNRRTSGDLTLIPTALANLGTSERFIINAGVALTNSTVSPVVVAVNSPSDSSATFVTHDVNGFAPAAMVNQTTTDINTVASTANFNANAAANLTANRTVNTLRIQNVAVSGNAGTTLALTGIGSLNGGSATQAGIILNGGTLSVPNVAAGSSELVIYTSSANGTVSSALATTGGITKTGPGTLTIGNTLPAGAFVINQGTVRGNATGRFNGTQNLTLNAASLLDLQGLNQSVGNFGGSATSQVTSSTGAAVFGVNPASSSTYAGSISGGALSLNKGGSGSLTLTGTALVPRALQVNFGTLTLGGTVALGPDDGGADAQPLNINQGATFTLDNTTLNLTDRVRFTKTSAPYLAILGGTFNFAGNASAASSESVGTGNAGNTTNVLFGAGSSTISATAGSGQSSVVTFKNSLTISAASSGLIKGTNLGDPQGGANVASVLFTTAPSLTGFSSGAGAAGTPQVGIISGVIADSVISGTDTYGLATYDKGLNGTAGDSDDPGVRRLTAAEHATNIAVGDTTTLNNVRLTAASNSITSATTVNALHLSTGSSINGASTLSVASGNILGTSTSSIGTTTPGTLAFDTVEARIYAVSGLTIGSVITGSGGLTKGGSGTLTLTNAGNSFGGGQGVTINGGLISVAADSHLGNAANSLRFNNGGGLQTTANLTSARGIVLGQAGGTLNVGSGTTMTVSGSISGGLGTIADGLGINNGLPAASSTVLTKSGSGTLTLTGANMFTGRTVVSAGRLNVGDGTSGTLGASADVSVSSGASLGGAGTIVGSVAISSGGTLAPGFGIGTLNTGSLTMSGSTPALTLEIAGNAVGQFDRLNVSGNVAVAGNLTLSLVSYDPLEGSDIFYVVLNDGTDAVSGAFTGLAQGATFTQGGQQWQISYIADSTIGAFAGFLAGGNDIAVLAVPEPSSIIIFLAGTLVTLGVRRRHRVAPLREMAGVIGC